MRIIAPLIACVGIALVVAGCDPTDRNYFKKGIGTELNSGDIAASTEAQNQYVEDICQQAGLVPAAGGVCGPEPFNPKTWQLFVQAGMNDIDQRCDAYLTWLDYVRRSREPTLKQLADTQVATTIIMEQAGVGAGPIAIAAAAFGLATNTFNNVTSRLILEVDHSTVQAVVLSHQKQYREELLGSTDKRIPPVVIASKPAAIYALRSYLRLCMPMTIETQINSIMTTFSRGGTPALDAGEPMISAGTVGVRPAVIRVQGTFGPDKVTELLNQWLRPGGVLDRDRLATLRDFVTKLKSGLQVQTFLTVAEFAAQRAQFARDHGVIQ